MTPELPSGNPGRRWDTDPRGTGVATGTPFRADLQRLAHDMGNQGWIAEDPDVHLLPDLRAAVARSGSPWAIADNRFEQDGRYVVRLTYSAADRSPRRLRAEVLSLVGSIAENSTHVRERSAPGRPLFEVITGLLDGDDGWRGHGHVLVLEVSLGPA